MWGLREAIPLRSRRAMSADMLTDVSKLFWLGTPFMYAAATFRLFHYVDKKISDEARTVDRIRIVGDDFWDWFRTGLTA